MKAYDYKTILKDFPLFAGLPAKGLQLVRQRSEIAEFKKGQVIYKEGSPPSHFYCVLRGRVVVSAADAAGRQNALECLHRGTYFGSISMLTGEPHSVTARALNDCIVLTIDRKNFDFLLGKIPAMAIDLGRTLSRRLKRKDLHPKSVFESTIIAVMSSRPQAGKTLYASNLAFSLSRETRKSVIILDICRKETLHRMPRILTHGAYRVSALSGRAPVTLLKENLIRDKFGIDLAYLTYKRGTQYWPQQVADILSALVNDYHYIILDLPCCREKTVLTILNQADVIHILSAPRLAALKSTARLARTLEREFHFVPDKIKVVINEKNRAALNRARKNRAAGRPIFATLPRIEPVSSGRIVVENPDAGYSRVIRRIARQEGGCCVGLALGVGMAYGFCHIGVLKVIEQEKIPIDMVSGSSMGAVIAALWATGRSSSEILRITREFGESKYIWNLLDFTFPLLGFIKGDRLYQFLKRHFGSSTFQEIRIPLKIVASELKRKETRVLDSGSLVDALMASCAMPGVFNPFKFKEELLYDGGVINPLPTEPLIEAGVKKVIAVNVTPSREDVLKHYGQVKEHLAGRRTKESWFRIKNYFKDRLKNNILDIVFSSFEIMQSEVAKKEALLADVVLHPDLNGMHWLELHRSAEFARKGEDEARRNLERIWQVVNE